MNIYIFLGSLLAILTYFPLWKQIWSGEARQNIFTWTLWGVLDGAAFVAIMLQNGSYLLPLAYTVGSFITVILILRSKDKPNWTWFETMVSLLVLCTMGIWYFSGVRTAIIAGSMASVIATIPQLTDAWKAPQEMPLMVYLSYLIANCLSTMGGKCWSIEERFFPFTGALICFLMVAFSMRRFLPKRKG